MSTRRRIRNRLVLPRAGGHGGTDRSVARAGKRWLPREFGRWHLVLVLLLCLPGKLPAHTLDSNTARVTLRDGHVDVVLSVGLLELLQHTAPEGTTLEPGGLLTASDSTLEKALARARQTLVDQSRLQVNGTEVGLELRDFPTLEALRTTLGLQVLQGHAPLTTLHLESPAAIPSSRTLSLQLPVALGSVLTTFVQPSTVLMPPGAAATFAVLAPPTEPLSAPKAAGQGGALAILLALMGLMANAVLISRLRRREEPSSPDHNAQSSRDSHLPEPRSEDGWAAS